MNSYKWIPAVIMAMCFYAAKGYAQKEVAYTPQIVLDKQVSAGDLTLFPELGNPDKFYYLPNQPRLKTREDGTPVISFLRYVKNGPDGKETDQGGVLHLLFGIEVTDDQLAEAKKELRKKLPEAVIAGPVIYRSGTVEIVTSEPADKTKKRVCGVGSAPVMDGDYIAVAVRLLSEEAKIMWETFKTPVPDISFNFNMVLAGYNSPIKAEIIMTYDKVYQHKIFSAGLAMNVLQADIQYAVQDMVNNDAIKITQVGSDQDMENIISRVIEDFKKEFCTSIGSPGGPNFGELAKAPDQQRDMLKRATDMYNTNQAQSGKTDKAPTDQQKSQTPAKTQGDETKSAEPQQKTQSQEKPQEGNAVKPVEKQPTTESKGKFGVDYNKVVANTPGIEGKTGGAPPAETKPDAGNQANSKKSGAAGNIAIAVSYQMKEIRMKGVKTFNYNKSLATTINTTFGGNVGKINCTDCFLEVNLDDPLLKVKEVYVTIDGMNASDFGAYINAVNVQLRKVHQSGEIDIKELVINREQFNQTGNNAKIWYGWKGDNNTDQFNQYDYKVHWSFFGGYNLNDADWRKSSGGLISLTPPFQRKDIELVVDDREDLLGHHVRFVMARIYYKLGDREFSRQVTFDLQKDITSANVDFILPVGQSVYEYEMVYVLKGNVEKSTGRKTASVDKLTIDNSGLN